MGSVACGEGLRGGDGAGSISSSDAASRLLFRLAAEVACRGAGGGDDLDSPALDFRFLRFWNL